MKIIRRILSRVVDTVLALVVALTLLWLLLLWAQAGQTRCDIPMPPPVAEAQWKVWP